jgi:predicted deacetylase
MSYLIRLDDACDTMNWEKWLQMERLLDKYQVKPLIAVIPNNADAMQKIDPPREIFWEWLKNLEDKGWEIGLHGNDHVYKTDEGGINPIHKRSEFAGLSLAEQKDKIKKGFSKLIAGGFNPRIFVAPSHTFDINTLEALKQESNINMISDTLAFFPYKMKDFIFIPQQFGTARRLVIPGTYTFCYHPNTMDENAFETLENFLIKYSRKFIAFNQLDLTNITSKSFFDKLLSSAYFQFRKIFR